MAETAEVRAAADRARSILIELGASPLVARLDGLSQVPQGLPASGSKEPGPSAATGVSGASQLT